MDELKWLQEINFVQVIMDIFIIISAVISIVTIVSKFAEYIGRPIKWIKKNDQDHELLIKTVMELQELRKQEAEDRHQSIKHDQLIRDSLEKLTTRFIEKEVDDTRSEILNFCSSVSNGQKHNREAFEHEFRLYEKYQRILKENNLTNGFVDESMNYVKEAFHKILP